MEKLLKDLIQEVKNLRLETKKIANDNEKKQKEMINFLAFQSQIMKQIAIKIDNLNKNKEETNECNN